MVQILKQLPSWEQGFVGRALGDPGLKPSVRVGEAAVREVAAFLLDREHFARVPHTVMVKVSSGFLHEHELMRRGLQSGCDEVQLPLLISGRHCWQESNFTLPLLSHCPLPCNLK